MRYEAIENKKTASGRRTCAPKRVVMNMIFDHHIRWIFLRQRQLRIRLAQAALPPMIKKKIPATRIAKMRAKEKRPETTSFAPTIISRAASTMQPVPNSISYRNISVGTALKQDFRNLTIIYFSLLEI